MKPPPDDKPDQYLDWVPTDDPLAGLDTWVPSAKPAVTLSGLRDAARERSEAVVDFPDLTDAFISEMVAEVAEGQRLAREVIEREFYRIDPNAPTPPTVPWPRRLAWKLDAALDRFLRWFGLARISRPPPEWYGDE